jgi:hypothetical protein
VDSPEKLVGMRGINICHQLPLISSAGRINQNFTPPKPSPIEEQGWVGGRRNLGCVDGA